jgi:hypothetical protein
MTCKQCASDNQSSFTGDVAVHFPGLKGLDKTHRLGLSEASGLFALRLDRVHRPYR